MSRNREVNQKSGSIIFFVTSLQSGGIENYLLRFLNLYHQRFDKIIIYSKLGKGGVLKDHFMAIPNVSLKISMVSYKRPYSYLQLKSWFKPYRNYTICDFTGNFGGTVVWIGKKAGINKRVVFYRRSSDDFQKNVFRSSYNNWVKKLVYKYATNILSNSKTALNYFHGGKWETDKRFKVIYNGIDVESFTSEKKNLRQELNIPKEAFVVGHTGRFDYAKNHDTILEVAEQLINRHSDVYFILCGDSVPENLKISLEKKGISNKVLTFGYRNDIPAFLNTMNCYFFPSVTEGQPNALIEAMISGVPIVASNIDPIKETTHPSMHSYLRDPLDVSGFSELIESIYHSSDYTQNTTLFTDWAISHFDYKIRFEQFYKILSSK